MARDPSRLSQRVRAGVEIVRGDVTDDRSLEQAFGDADVASYLVHSMGDASGFEEREQAGARNFAMPRRPPE